MRAIEDSPAARQRRRRLVVAHPSADVYGSDLQLLESIRAAVADGWDVVLLVPDDGPLTPLAERAGADIRVAGFPVLRKSMLSPRGLVRLGRESAVATVRAARWLSRASADAVYVNTLTIPVWLAAARLAGVPALCHVHEAEEDPRPVVTAALTGPLLLATRLVVNSEAARRTLGGVFRGLPDRARVVYNGVPGPPGEAVPAQPEPGVVRLALVGRLSPRKGTDVALEAVAILARAGRDVRLRVCGSTFPGYEWFETELRERAAQPDLDGRVELLGYVSPTWAEVQRADVVLVPSRVEPFGNTAVEALLAGRPVVASRTQGLAEIVRDRETGLLVEPGDPEALAAAIADLADDVDLRHRLAEDGRRDALARFGVDRYAADVRRELRSLLSG